MKFSELMLRARQEVHDYRDSSGNIIVDSAVDGIRWTSANLADAMKEALMELTRDIISINYRHYFNSAYLYRNVPGSVDTAGIFTPVDTSAPIADIIRLESQVNTDIYEYVDPDLFYSKEYMANRLDDDEYVFTRVSNQLDNVIVTNVLPIPAEDLPAKAICTVNLSAVFILTNLEELPFSNIDDLELDYIQRRCNKIEYDYEQYALVDKIIEKKLLMIKSRDNK